ncbi:hypothetical protein GE061_005280 [Apolygus lucorum]|uniref:Uncharacterized protein n=1 Tax=Apolygus lucorum TaxID=248454 RepID=A0A8S9WVX3_APOLU|nr:hypothetical protein GE061_005280 [Apolygus lucorum]
MDTISTELEKLEEKANDDLETYYDRLLTVGSELRSKANLEQDQEVQDILKAVGDLVKPLKRLTAVTSKSIAVIVEDNKMGNIPAKKIVESLLKPLDALDASLSLLESVGMLKSHKTIRGAGIPILYKVSVPMEELETTIKLVENLSAHSAVEFLIPPLDNLIKVVSDIDVSTGGDGFLEDLLAEGTPIVKNLDDSLDIMLNCINSVDKGVAVVESERGIPGKLPALLKPMEDLQKSLKAVEKGIVTKDIGYEDVYEIAQELSKPLQSIRSEFSILQHEIEADHYSSEPNPSQTALTTLVEPLESVQNCISSFHETIMCKSADDPMHLRFVLYALKELAEPLSSLSGRMIKAEELLLGKGDPFQGLKAVARSVSELRESSSAVTTESNVIEQMSNTLSDPLNKVQIGLENILQFVDKKDKQDLNKDLLKSMDEPFKELQCALLKIEGNIHENVTEGVTPELRQAVQELQRSILIIQDQSSFEYGDEPSTIEANIDTLQSLTQPLQTLHAQFTEVQRSANRTLMKAERALITLKDSTRRVSSTITELKTKRSETPSSVSHLLQVLGATVEELEAAVEDANLHLGRGKRVDDTRRILANTLKVASTKFGEVCSKADDLSVSIEPSKRKSLVLVQDYIHNLKVAIEQSTRVIDCDKGTAMDRSRDTLIAIEQLAIAMSQFHDQLKSVEEFTASASEPQGMSAMKEQVDKLQTNVAKALTSNISDKNDKMILETIENDVKSVQRVLDNLLSEDAADGARVRFILAKTESIHSDLKDMVQSADSPSSLKNACQAALSVLDIGEGLMNRKSPMKMEIISQVEAEPEVSVIGELLETLDELDRCFNRLKREEKIKVANKEVAEMAMEIATLQALVQDIATEASGELLDKVIEVCIPIKAIEVKLSHTKNLTSSDLEQTSESLHNINQVLNSAIRKKEAEKLIQPSTSIIGELLETVGDLEASFDRLKRGRLPEGTTESEVNDVGREILALQNIVDDLTSEATGELLDRAQEICIPIKSIESSLKQYAVLNKASVCEVKDKLKMINNDLKDAIAQNEIDKQKREKEFEKLFSSDSLSSSVDVPIVRSIVTTIEYMQAHLNSLIAPPDMVEVKNFLERFECSLEHVSDLEAALKTADLTRVEMRKLVKAVEGLKSSRGEMSKALPALQSVLSPLKTLHEELSRPNSPKRLKKAELKYLESFSKSSTDLELGLMKLEKAIVTGTRLEVECMAAPVEQLASFIDGISHEPSLKNLDEESSIAALKSLAQPINAIQTIVEQVQNAVVRHDDKKAAELLTAVSKPVRELRTNIALIQDQAMMNCSLSQLDELKQAVALMTQVGTETPALKQPLLQLQARLQELEAEAELAEVVSELTAPVEALKQAVAVMETKGESSMLLELCHQVVEIINRGDDTLSEMSSIGPLSTKADALPGDALLKAATLCHELLEDQSLSELSHTDDTLTPTHAAEQLPSIHGAATAEQRVLFEQVESLKSSPISLQEAAKGGSVAGKLKAGLIEHEIFEDQTISEISEMENSMSATLAVEKLPSIRGTVAGEQKMVLEEAESFNKTLKSTTEANVKGVQQEHLKIATTEHNVLEDHSLSDLSPNDLTDSGTLPIEKLTSVRGTVAAEEKLVYEQAQVWQLLWSLPKKRELRVLQLLVN